LETELAKNKFERAVIEGKAECAALDPFNRPARAWVGASDREHPGVEVQPHDASCSDAGRN
jgi:hypothetical protein